MAATSDIFITYNDNFLQHLKDHLHISRQNTEEGVQTLLQNSARYNKENRPRKLTTCFLRPITTLQGKVYAPFEQSELLSLIKKTIRYGNNRRNNRGRIEATHRFDRCVGIHSTFKNGRDKSDGYELTEIYSVKVIYILARDKSIIVITAFPLLEEIQTE